MNTTQHKTRVQRLLSLALAFLMAFSALLALAPELKVEAAGAAGNCNGDHTGWTEWNNNEEMPSTAGKYYLSCNMAIQQWSVPTGETTICLNGHEIDFNNKPFEYPNNRFNSTLVLLSNTLNVHDCKGTGTISRGGAEFGVFCIFPGGVLNLYGGTIRDSNVGVYMEPEQNNAFSNTSARFNMYGGTIQECSTAVFINSMMIGGGGFNMYGGTLKNKVEIYNFKNNYTSDKFNTMHYFGGELAADPQVLIGNKQPIFVGGPLTQPLRIKNEYGTADGSLIAPERGYTLTAEDAQQVISPDGKKLPVVDPATKRIMLKEVKPLDTDALTLDPINYGQKANEAVIHGSVTVDGTTPFAGTFRIDDTTVYNAGTHTVNVKFQAEGRSEELTYSASLTVNRVPGALAWEETATNQTQQLKTLAQDITKPKANYNYEGEIQYSYQPADAADTTAWTDGLPTAIGTYTVKASIPQTTNYFAAESSNTLTLTVIDVPDAPASLNVTPNPESGTATATWQAPAYVGSSEITGYTAEWLKDGNVIKTEELAADVLTSTLTLTDAAQNGSYTFRVTATNAAGTGAPAQKENVVASVGLVVTKVEGGTFTKKNYIEGEVLDAQNFRSARLTYNDGTTKDCDLEQLYEMGAWLELRRPNPPTVKIDNYKTWTFTTDKNTFYLYLMIPKGIPGETISRNAISDGQYITVAKAFPSEPRNLEVRTGDGRLDVTWKEPEKTYGKEIIGYTIVCKDGSTPVATKEVDGAARSVTFDGLTNETTYTIEIQAKNSNGLGKTAKITGKPSTYAMIRVTACPTIPFGDNPPNAPRDGVSPSNGSGKIIYDLTNLTDLKVEFLSDAQTLANGDGLLVTFTTKKLTEGFDLNQKFRVTPKVQVVDADGNVKTSHSYTILTQAQDIKYSERDIGEDPKAIVYGVWYSQDSVEYRGKVINPASKMLFMRRGESYMTWFPYDQESQYSQVEITNKYYDYVIYDPQGNQVDGYRDAGVYTVVLTGKNGCTGTLSGTVTVTPRRPQIVAKEQNLTYGTPLTQGADAAKKLYSLGPNDYLKSLTVTASSYDVTAPGENRYVTLSNPVIWDSVRNMDVTNNYAIDYLTNYEDYGKLTIKRANNPAVGFVNDPTILEYNNGNPIENPPAEMLTFTGAYYEDIKFEWQDAEGNPLAAAPTTMGSYKLRAYLEDNANHGAAEATVDVQIAGRRLDEDNMTLAGPFVYNGREHTPAVTVKDGETVIDASKYTATYGNNTNAGTATVTVADNDGTDTYEIGGTLTFTIDPCPLSSLTASVNNAGPIVYNGTEQTPGVTVTGPDGTTLTETTDYTVAYTNNRNAGTATATITAVAGGNYTGTKELTFTIAQKPVTPALTGTSEKVYDSTAAAPAGLAVTLNGVEDADADTLTASAATITYNSANVAQANTITAQGIALSGTAAGNYTLGTATTATTPGTITPKSITGAAVTLGTALTYNGSARTQTVTGVTVDGLTLTEDDYAVTGNTQTNAGLYILTVEGKGNFTGEESEPYTISRMAIDTPPAITGLIYDGREKTGVAAEGCTLTGHTATAAGTHDASVTPDGNHQWLDGSTGARTVTWSIDPRPITVTANNAQKVYHGPEPATLTYTPVGLVKGETLTGITCARDVGEDVGTYAITPSQPAGANPNYAITFGNGTFTITHKPVAVPTAGTGLVYTGDAQTGVPGGEGYTLTGSTGTDAGSYTAVATLESNYCWQGLTGRDPQNIDWSIAKAPGNLTAGVNQTVEKTYKDPAFALNATHAGSGVVSYESNNPNVATVDTSGTVTLKNVGTATLTVTLPETDNYLGGTVTVTLTVVRKDATLTVDALRYEVHYGDPAFTIYYACEAENPPEFASDNEQVATVDQSGKVEIKSAGTAQITVTIPQSGNYNAVSQTVTVKVAPREITVTPNNETRTYGDPDPEFSYTPSSLVGTDSLTGIAVTRAPGKDVGSYALTATQPAGANPNYAITFAQGSLTITQRVARLEWKNTDLIYNGAEQKPQAVVKNLVAGDSCNVTVEGSGTDTGGFTARATALDNPNYALPTEQAQVERLVTIAPKPIAVPQAVTGLVYNGTVQTGVPEGEGYTLTGNTATNAGDYTAVATLEPNYCWLTRAAADTKDIPWSIAKADAKLITALSQTTRTEGDPDFAIGVTHEGPGQVTYATDNPQAATVDATGTVHIAGTGTAVITVTLTETDNYRGARQRVTVTVRARPQPAPAGEGIPGTTPGATPGAAAAATEKLPQTGDTDPVRGWTLLWLASLAGLTGALLWKKRRATR